MKSSDRRKPTLSWKIAPLGETPDALYETLRERGLANAALSLLASPLLPKGEASAKGEDRIFRSDFSLFRHF
ncbi:hypothetical protein [Nostoc sp.]|uniref:hypothetical protein n=1 Tax=Nostoc sp. TaxID=1180 RepID=UPI002FFC53D5